MKIPFIAFSILIYSFAISLSFGQTISHDVITTSGESSNNGIDINWTLGEPICETANNGLIITQGYQQPKAPFDFTYIPFVSIKNLNVQVFPNPTSQKIFINITESNLYTFKINLFNMNGILILDRTSKTKFNEIDLADLPRSVYLLRIICLESGAMTQYKIEKIY